MVPLLVLILALGFSPVKLQGTNCGQERRDVAFLLDVSNTIPDEDFFLLRNFVKDVVSCFSLTQNEIRIAMITFALTADIRFNFTTFENNLPGALAFIMTLSRGSNGFNTRTDLAIKELREVLLQPDRGDRSNVDNTIIVFTDGRATRPIPLAQELAQFNRTFNEFFSIGVGTVIDEDELQLIANPERQDHVFTPGGFENLAPLKDTVVNFACPPCMDDCQNMAKCNRPTNTCNCTEGFVGDRCELCEALQ